MGNMRFKVGDRVRIKSLDWYNENKDNYGAVYAGNGFAFWNYMAGLCGEIMTISSIKVDPEDSNKGYYFMENSEEKWTDEMIEGLVEEETYDFLKTDKPNRPSLNDFMDMLDNEIKLPQGYQFKDENGNIINATKIVLEKKKKEYPKTYGYCCDTLECCSYNVGFDRCETSYDDTLHNKLLALRKLIICRDAYWKIAGEEMGLGKPWEPDWENSEERRYSIVNIEGDINLPEKTLTKWILKVTNKILVFPTEEMRDAFYENFKGLIEECKELL